MKRHLDRCRETLSEEQWEAFAREVGRKLGAGRTNREATLRRWVVSAVCAGLAVLAVAVAMTLSDRHPERPRPTMVVVSPGISQGGAGQVAAGPGGPEPAVDRGRAPADGGAPEAPFISAREQPVSSFPLRASAASYERARESIRSGRLPDPAEVRLEGFVNAFRQGYPPVAPGECGVFVDAAATSPGEGLPAGSLSAGEGALLLVRIGVKAGPVRPAVEPEGGEGERHAGGPARVEVVFDPWNVLSYRLLGFDAPREPASDGARPPAVEEMAPGTEVTALYEVRLTSRPGPGEILTARLQAAAEPEETGGVRGGPLAEGSLSLAQITPSIEAAPPRLRLDQALVDFARALQSGAAPGSVRLAGLLPAVRRLARELPDDPAVSELPRLVETAAALAGRRV